MKEYDYFVAGSRFCRVTFAYLIANAALHSKYIYYDNVISRLIIGWLLAKYKYYDMAPTVEKVMNLFNY